jgi:hypothetical protein
MTRAGPCIGLICIAIACSEVEAPQDAGVSKAPYAELVEVHGQVRLTHAGNKAPAVKGPLSVGDSIETGEDGSARITFRGGRQIEVSPNSLFSISEDEAGILRLDMDHGLVISRTPDEGAGVALNLKTPYGITRVPAEKGEVEVKVGGEGASLNVKVGQATFESSDGKKQSASAGDTLKVRLGELSVERPQAEPGREPIEVVFTLSRGVAHLRERAGLKWRPAKAREVLANGARFQLDPSAAASLQAGGIRAGMEGVTLVTLDGASRGDDGEKLDIRLESGSAELRTPPDSKHRVLVLGGPIATSVNVGGESQIRARATPTDLHVEAVTGNTEIQAGEVKHAFPAGSAADVSRANGLQVTPILRAAVIIPASRRVNVFADSLQQVALTWPQEGETWHRVEVSHDESFRNPIISGPVVRGFVNLPARVNSEFRWRVFGQEGAKPAFVGIASVHPDAGRSRLNLAHPRNEVADSGLKTTVYFQGALPELTFTYPKNPDAIRYRFRAYRASDLTTPVVDKVVEETRCTVAAGLLNEGDYRWYASPLDSTDAEIEGGRMNKLELVYDNSLPTLQIDRPLPGERVRGRGLEAKGVAPIGSRVSVNGAVASIDDKGRFQANIRAPAGAVVFHLVDKDGNESLWVRWVKVGG